MIGRIKGGLAYVAILSSMFFAAISGSSAATAAAVGAIMIPGMLEKGYDCNYVLKNNGTVSLAAVLRDEKSGRSLEVYTDLPGIQFYSGNYIDKKGAKGMEYKDFHGLCLETQQFPDAINHPDFPSPVIKAGEEYKTTTIYKFSV